MFRAAIEARGVGLWEWDVRNDHAFFDAAWKRQLGFSEQEFPNRLLAWHQRVHPEDLERLRSAFTATKLAKEPALLRLEYRLRHKDDSYRHILCLAVAERDEHGRLLRWEGSHEDVTDQRAAEEALARQRGQVAACIEHCPLSLAMFDTDMRYLAASAQWRSHYGLSPSILGRSHYEVFPELPERWKEVHQRCLAGDHQRAEEDTFVRADGSVEWLRWEVHPWHTPDGGVGGIVIFAEALTEKRRTQESLRHSEERLRLAVRGAKLATWHWNLQTNQVEGSAECWAMFGLSAESPLTFESAMAHVHPDDQQRVRETVQYALDHHSEYEIEFRCLRPDGTCAWLSSRARAYEGTDTTPPMMEGVALDITPRKEAERVLRESEEQLRSLADAIPHLVSQIAPDGRYIYTNKRWRDYFSPGASAGDQTFTAPALWARALHPEDAERVRGAWDRILKGEEGETTYEIRIRDRTGEYHWVTARAVPVWDSSGQLLYTVATATDIDPLKRAEEALRESEERLHAALRAGGIGTSVWEIEEDRMLWDEPLLELLGRTRQEMEAGGLAMCMDIVHPEDRALVREVLADLLLHGEELNLELRVLHAAGHWIWVSIKGRVERDASGKPLRVTKAVVDMTRHKQLEEELRQAQKLEGIGQLAGGVAHDFNNILTVVLAQASMLEARRDLPPSISAPVHEIERAAERAAGLTAQLLAFGRRSMMQPQNVDLNQTILEALRMLTPILGEDIALRFDPTPEAIVVFADSNMLTQVLLNLAVNARDAMPHGGSLQIRTSVAHFDDSEAAAVADVSAGRWAMFSLSDSGSGIAPDVLPHVFEPFFTTKEVGQGSGLGLSTVYGIIKQHRGSVTVDTTLGRGTTFKVLLPLVEAPAETMSLAAREPAPHGEGRTVLVVEDEGAVRAVLARSLESQGYEVLQAADGVEAVRTATTYDGDIDLLLTDVMMPGGLSGLQVAELVRSKRPQIKTILTSGHSKDIVTQGFQSQEPGMLFLQKPYNTPQLLACVERALASSS
ncbi:MAG: PAS domain-containing protein [Myxococcales bacterium]